MKKTLTFGYCLVGMSTRSLSLRFLVAKRSRYVSFSGSFLVSPFWILSISAKTVNTYAVFYVSLENKTHGVQMSYLA